MTGGPTTFAIDIDSTLYDLMRPARDGFLNLYEESGNREYLKGAYLSWDEWRSPADACGLDAWLRVIDYCHSPEIIARQRPFEGAAETLNALQMAGYDLMYISDRNIQAAAATENWLWDNGFPNSNKLHCTRDKHELMSHCQYLIDDRPKTLVEFVSCPDWEENSPTRARKGLGLMYQYNRALTDIPDIFLSPTWNGLRSWLKRKNIL